MSWNQARLKAIAAREALAFADARVARLALAIYRHQGLVLERPLPVEQSSRELEAALDAITVRELEQLAAGPEPVVDIVPDMLELKAERLRALAAARWAAPAADAEPIDDAEPTQG